MELEFIREGVRLKNGTSIEPHLTGVLSGKRHSSGRMDDAANELAEAWPKVIDRDHELVPAYGFTQAERELASTGAKIAEITAPR